MHGVLPTVHYLQDLGAEHLKLILEFGTWILESEPSVAMKVSKWPESFHGEAGLSGILWPLTCMLCGLVDIHGRKIRGHCLAATQDYIVPGEVVPGSLCCILGTYHSRPS